MTSAMSENENDVIRIPRMISPTCQSKMWNFVRFHSIFFKSVIFKISNIFKNYDFLREFIMKFVWGMTKCNKRVDYKKICFSNDVICERAFGIKISCSNTRITSCKSLSAEKILLCRQSAFNKSLHFSWHFTPHSVQRTPCRAIPQSNP
jgi:hypothetical protein